MFVVKHVLADYIPARESLLVKMVVVVGVAWRLLYVEMKFDP